MASCITAQWANTSSPQAQLTVTTKSSTDTSVTYSWTLQYIAKSAASTSTARAFTAVIDGATVYNGTYSINGKKGTYTIASGTKTINKGTAARTITYKVTAAWKLTWSGTYCESKSASGTFSIAAKTSYKVTFDANGGSLGNVSSSQTKWHGTTLTLDADKPTRSGYTFLGWSTSKTATTATYAAGASYTANAAATLYAIWRKTLTLSYSMNGGSGTIAAKSENVYNATTSYKFTLSSTKPTRTGYTFLGWSTSSTATSASYSSGGTITISANTTIYAVWKINTYTITYNANGGTGGPTTQTKTYGTTLTLSTSKPTRSLYNFLGWSTSKTATTATYKAGGSFTTNAATTLYAVWELAYVKPRIFNIEVSRCQYGADGTSIEISDEGTMALISFEWECDYDVDSIIIEWNSSPVKTHPMPEQTGKSGQVVDYLIGPEGTFSTERAYTFTITVEDSQGSNYGTAKMSAMAFVIDFLNGGKGISFGKPADKEGFECEFPAIFNKHMYMANNYNIYAKKADGSGNLSMLTMSTSNNTSLGYGGYEGTIGGTYIYGNNLYLMTKNYAYMPSGVLYFGASSGTSGSYFFSANTGNVGCNTLTAAGAASLKSTLGVTGNTTLTGWLKPNGGTYLPNGVHLYGYASNGTSPYSLAYIDASNVIRYGYGSYANGAGSTILCGNAISIVSKGNVAITGAVTISSTLGVTGNINTDGGVYADTNIRIGNNGVLTTEYALATYWKDNTVHNLASRATDGLTSYFGWAGSSSYASVCNLRSRTVKYSNSSGTTTLSDVRLKKDFESLDRWADFFDAIEPCAFRMKTGNSGRFHLGYKAQQVVEALSNSGLTTQDFAGFIKMAYLPDSDNEDLRKAYEEAGIKEGEDEYGLVYTEFVALNTHEIQKLKKRVDILEAKVEEQDERIAKLEALVEQLLSKEV